MKTRFTKATAWLLTFAMLMTFMPGITLGVSAEPTVLETSTKENSNQAGGIIYTKTSTAKSDGTIDITLTAHTTGEVKQLSSVTPTDIVLVLDTSGSMNDRYTTTHITGYNAATGGEYTYTTGMLFWAEEHTAYGFSSSSTTYYVNTGTSEEPVYTRVTSTGRDGNGFDMYEYSAGTNEIIVYPVLNTDPSVNRTNNYPVVQFYTAATTSTTVNKMVELKSAVKSFIDTTAQMNEGLDTKDMHNISIVRFASNASVVAELTAVDQAGASSLKNAVDRLSPNGATGVDYGLEAAEEVLMNRSEVRGEKSVERNEVIIVFTDGDPNHQSGFDTRVANDAIEIAGKLKKDAGVVIYSVCIAEGADASDVSSNTNKFMHYVSSNYPNATSMTSSGSRASSGDYYKTIGNDNSLSLIFESIIQDIDHPTISMGEEAAMVDTLSPYFDFVGTASNVKLQTRLRNADGTWAAPVVDNSLECEMTEDRLIVNGFDFDANFVSSTGRGDNRDFYGKQLVVTFTVSPDYSVIDAASATLMGGILPTNSGFASLNDSEFTPAAEVETPELSTHQVLYKVDGVETASYNRFTGSEVAVDSIPTKAGYTFSGWKMNGTTVQPGEEFTMPDNDVEITGTFTANTWTVKYQYSGTVPQGAPALPADAAAVYGSTVNVAPKVALTGYIFTGWYPLQTDVSVAGGTFTMPDKDVTLVGYFEGSTSTPYKVEHYLETLTDGVYETTPALVEDGFTGTTGNTVTATPLNRFAGFAYNEAKSASTISGEIAPDGSLVLKVYYDRNEYKLTYSYSGDIPQNAPAKPNDETYKFGESVTVAGDVSVAGYTFKGWESQATDKTAGETFTMPAHNVAFIGEFSANTDTQYKVEYYLQNIENNEYTLVTEEGYTNTATTGATVYAIRKVFTGFVFDEHNTANKLSGVVAGDGSLVLKLYYNRETYSITYAYEGAKPDGAPEVPTDSKEYKYGETVTVKPDLAMTGYNFAGWHSSGYTVNNETVSFEMPARDVTLYGNFEPASGIIWKEEHYFESLTDDEYVLDGNYTVNHTGTTGQDVSAVPVADIAGFTYNEGLSNANGTVAGDDSTVLRFYYDRNSYDVRYIYDPAEQPAGAPALPSIVSYKYGAEVTVEAKLSLMGYDFAGWDPEQSGIPADGTFTMPAFSVVFEGGFVPRSDTKYEVHHHLMKVDGTYPAEPDFINEHTGTTGHEVPAIPRNFEGYVLNESESQMSGTVKADGSLVLDLKYDRIKYKVTYAFEGDIPAGVTQPAGNAEYMHGVTVAVEPIPASIPAGYGFVGWYRGAINNPISGTFEMPKFDVHILGRFVEKDGVTYKVEHYLQNTEGTDYNLDSSETRYGKTGDPVVAYAKEYPGYESTMSSANGNIAGDGSLVLKFYYNRKGYDVTYQYEGIAPVGAPALPALETYKYGTDVTVAAVPSIPGYTFAGWYDGDDTNVLTSFEMPDRPVVLKGKFASNLVDYQVKYWFQNIDAGDVFNESEYTLDAANSYTRQAYVGEHVEAEAKEHTGFSVNAHSSTYGHVTVDDSGTGNLVLNVYFDRHTYNITYGYYGEQPAGVPDLSDKNKTSVRFGTVVDVDSKPTYSGYEFDGWYTRTATVENGKFTMPDHDVTFLGRFTQMHTVSYDLNGGTGAEGVNYSTENVAAGSAVIVKEAPARTGYTFTGWKSEIGENASGDSVAVNQNITFVAQWSYSGGGGGGGITKFTLTYDTNGGNKIESEKHTYGKVVKIDKIPEREGYVFEGWYEDKELTKEISEVKMTKNITVYANWVKDNGSAGSGYDTPDSLNGEDHFAYVVGYPDGTVRPNDNISRAEVTSIFFRLLKPDEVRDNNLTSVNNFDDVNAEDWHNTAISTMAKLGIVNGRIANAFVPNAYITRAEFAAICARFDDSEFEIKDNFTDVGGHWAEAYIHEAAAHGWIKGYDDGTFRPDRFITRAEAMTMINRVLNRVPESADDLHKDMKVWPDNSSKATWYYLPVQEATNSHDYKMKNHIYEKWTAVREVADWSKYE